ncbi:MAG TPA: restriction endonuclease subunit S [Methylococcus sp.]|nr:restriction endonuclease subunit S [Methylococcus sp.]
MTNPNWTWRPLGELFEIGAGKTMSAAARAGTDKVPFLRTSNVLWDDIDLTEVDEMSIPPSELADKSLKAGDLLVCEGGEIGRAAVWDGRVPVMAFQNHLHRLRPIRGDVEPRFYVYFLQSAFTQLGIFEGAGNKTTIPNLSRNRLASLEVPHPSVAEQREIARALAKVREAIRVHDKAAATAQELKRAAMRELFTRGLRGEPQKDTEIGPVPESWVLEPIGAHFSVASGGTPSRGNPAYWTGGSVPWVKTTEVDYCEITETEEHITPEGLENSAAKLLPKGTLLMAMYGQGITRGKVAILGIEAACNQACAAMSPLDDAVRTRFLYHFLTWQYEEIRSLAHGGQQQNLNLEIVRSLLVAVPPTHAEQDDIVAILDTIDRKIELHRKKRAVLEELFKALLHKLMTGEIRVDELDLSALECCEAEAEEAVA